VTERFNPAGGAPATDAIHREIPPPGGCRMHLQADSPLADPWRNTWDTDSRPDRDIDPCRPGQPGCDCVGTTTTKSSHEEVHHAMTAAVLTRPTPTPRIPTPRVPMSPAPAPLPERTPPTTPAVAYQRVLHRTVRREFRLLAELASWATPDDAERTGELTRHADLIARVLLQHHATERQLLWPALFRHLPADEQDAAREHVAEWTSRTALLDHTLRDLSTHARQWAVARTQPARDAFVRAVGRVATAVDASTGAEECALLPLLGRHLPDSEWAAVARKAQNTLSGPEQMLVLGLALEDASAIDRARLMAGLSPSARTAWRLFGRRTFRAAVVRLRGAPPAA
jgi:hypothetical protein